MNFSNIINGIYACIEEWEHKLSNLPIDMIEVRRNDQHRTIKQILGHLIDSAANNHQRIIRLQYNKKLDFPDYQQDNDLWIALQDYQHADWNAIIQLWKFYNIHMAHVIKSVDCASLDNSWQNFESTSISLKEMIEGYLDHIELHLNQIQGLIDEKP